MNATSFQERKFDLKRLELPTNFSLHTITNNYTSSNMFLHDSIFMTDDKADDVLDKINKGTKHLMNKNRESFEHISKMRFMTGINHVAVSITIFVIIIIVIILIFKYFGKFLYCVRCTKTFVADANKYERDTKNKTSEDIAMADNKKIDNVGYCIVESKDKESKTLYPVIETFQI